MQQIGRGAPVMQSLHRALRKGAGLRGKRIPGWGRESVIDPRAGGEKGKRLGTGLGSSQRGGDGAGPHSSVGTPRSCSGGPWGSLWDCMDSSGSLGLQSLEKAFSHRGKSFIKIQVKVPGAAARAALGLVAFSGKAERLRCPGVLPKAERQRLLGFGLLA